MKISNGVNRVSMHLFLGSLFAVASAATGFFLFKATTPQRAEPWQFALIYFTVFLLIFGLTYPLGYFLRFAFWREGTKSDHLRSARRQAAMLGFLGVISLLLQAASFLNLKTSALLLAIFLLLELYAQ